MGHRTLRPILIFAFVAAALAEQNSFPHAIGKPGAKIEYLYKSHLPNPVKKTIIDLVFQKSKASDCVFPGRTEQQEVDFIRVARVKLSEQGTDLLVQASDRCNCGATGNCGFWVLHQTQSGFEILLATYGVQEFSVEPTRTQEYKDVMTASHYSASRQELVLYQFDGKQYRPGQCATAEYQYTGKKIHGYEAPDPKPIVTPEPCAVK